MEVSDNRLVPAALPSMIETARPHYLLFAAPSHDGHSGRWRFVLRTADGAHRLEASDVEPEAWGERLELMTVVRGLEAIEQPSRVTLIVTSTYIREGVLRGVAQWRSNGWRWERFGQMVPVKNLDLWQRVDRAMRFHWLDCRTYRIDPPHPSHGRPTGGSVLKPAAPAAAMRPDGAVQYRLEVVARTVRRWLQPWLRPWLRPWLQRGLRVETRLVARSDDYVEHGEANPFPPGPHLTL
jgi:ribonuclease HI